MFIRWITKTGKTALLVFICLVVMTLPGQSAVTRPKLIFGDDIYYPPYSYLDENGEPTGYNVELARAVGNAMGYDVEIRLDEWHLIRDALEEGEIDVISGMFHSEDRESIYSFSIDHSAMTGDIFTKQGVFLTTIDELRDQTVAVQKDDIVAEYLDGLGLNIKLLEVSTVKDALMMVEEGTVEYAGVLKAPGLYILSEYGIKDLKAQEFGFLSQGYAMAVRKGDEDLIHILNGGLQLVRATGEYDIIYGKWLSALEERGIEYFFRRYKWVLVTSALLLILLIGTNLFLRYMVEQRTRALKKMNFNLLESEYKNKAILNALPDIVFTLDGHGTFLDCQHGDGHELFAPKEVFIGKTIEEVLPSQIAKKSMTALSTVMETGSMQNIEYDMAIGTGTLSFEMRMVRSGPNEVIAIARDITEDKIRRERVEFLSYHDQLTGLYNRRFFVEELHRLDVERNYPLCIIMADVNGLKLINDSFGHVVGDELLIKVSEVLREACRADEIISRIGGDEFVILIPNIENAHAEQLIERIQSLAAGVKVSSVNLSVSFGWDVKKNPDEDIQEVFNNAEDMMYRRKLLEGPNMRGKTVDIIIDTINSKSKVEKEHSENVAKLCKAFAKSLDFTERDVEAMKTIGLLHDIGKIAINDELLYKKTELTTEEFEDIKKHSEIGYRILSSVNDFADIANFILHHHERWDGTGYPMGISGEEIPLESRIIAIVDAYDAMINDRHYKNKMSVEEAKAELKRKAGTQFDPRLVSWFITKINPTEQKPFT
ncbi:MAG: transporter substrate-binding domain-containing protein [Clostridiales bacterium]|nr:transporter substrate-binding domain-containing protein [Clostridiales bacterium]